MVSHSRLSFVRTLLLCLTAVMLGALLPSLAHANLALQLVTDQVSSPVFVTHAPGDPARLFIVEQGGRILVVRNDTLLSDPFLDLSNVVTPGTGERGLLGLAFHPQYRDNGYFYVNYTADGTGATTVARYSESASPDLADASSGQVLLTVAQPFGNHNAGMLAFGPNDGYLYVGMGDGGSGGDPDNRAQSPTDLLGKMLRIDIDGAFPYAIPSDNPYAASVDTLPEIWAFGLRNPWRYSFDRETGDLYIGDVGQLDLEEIDFQPASSNGGENYGWRLKEGTQCYNPASNCVPAGLVVHDPIYEYTHGGNPFRCSVTGGYVYRGCAIPDLVGAYLFADYCSGQVWKLRYVDGGVTDFADLSADLESTGMNISSFGQDYAGELYICDYSNGAVYKIVPEGPPVTCGLDCCEGIRGNLDGDTGQLVNIVDLSYLVAFLFNSGPAAICPAEGNVDGDSDEDVNIVDLTHLVAYLFSGGAAPGDCAG